MRIFMTLKCQIELRPLALAAIIMGAMTGCGPNRQQIIQQKIDQMVNDYQKKKKAECRASLLLQAEKTVDSMLLAEAQMILRDSLNRARAGKPDEPVPIQPIDSLAVKPIFE
jgi:hypothetical protein